MVRATYKDQKFHIVVKNSDGTTLCGCYTTMLVVSTDKGATCSKCLTRYSLYLKGHLGKCKCCGKELPLDDKFDHEKMMHTTCSKKQSKIDNDFINPEKPKLRKILWNRNKTKF